MTAAFTLHTLFLYAIVSVFFLAVGSLLNVIIYRLPRMLEDNTSSLNLAWPRSFCPHCRTMIPCWHNIPLVSYINLRGRCHHCHHDIAWRYPVVEAACLLLSWLTVAWFGLSLTLVFALPFVWILICLFVIDIETQLLPDSLTLSLLWIGLIANTQSLFTSLPNAVLSAAGAYVCLWMFIQLYFICTKKTGMGHGDFKLFAAFGAWFGWNILPVLLFIASLTGAIIGGLYLKINAKSRYTPIPFGPFLCTAGLLGLFFQKTMLSWLFSMLK